MEALKELIYSETGTNVNKNSRERKVVEIRALYLTLLKELSPILTLTEIGETVNKNHTMVIYLLRNYKVYERHNKSLKELKLKLIARIEEERILNLNNNKSLRLEVKRLQEESDDLAIRFSEWLNETRLYNEEVYSINSYEELLEIYKKEKGL